MFLFLFILLSCAMAEKKRGIYGLGSSSARDDDEEEDAGGGGGGGGKQNYVGECGPRLHLSPARCAWRTTRRAPSGGTLLTLHHHLPPLCTSPLKPGPQAAARW